MGNHKKVGVGIVGCGTISHIYMTNLKNKFNIIELISCYDIIPERAKRRAEEFGLEIMSTDDMVKDPRIEIILNLTTPMSHYDVSKQVLEAGKNCVVEKMMCVTFEEAQELCKIAENKNLYFGSVPDTFLGGGWQSIRKYIDDGFIGKPVTMNAVITCSYQPSSKDFDIDADHYFFPLYPGGGLPYDLGGYYIHNMINLFGSVKKVSGFGGNINPNRTYTNPHHPKYKEEFIVDTPTTLTGILEFESGLVGSLVVSSDASVYDTFTVQGSDATLEMFHPNFYSGKIILKRLNAKTDEANNIGLQMSEGYRPDPVNMELPNLYGYCDNNRGLCVADMAYAIRNKRRPRIHYDLGLHAMEIIHGMLESNDTGNTYVMKTKCERPQPRKIGVDQETAQEITIAD